MKNGLHIDEEGNKRYYLNDKRHRENGPAIEYADGDTFWYLNDKRHRVDGPAIEFANGDTFWYINGKELIHSIEFKNMQEFFQHLNDNEEYSLPWINDFNGIISFIKNPTGKQTRLHAMRWKI